jgi:uncharacterized protein
MVSPDSHFVPGDSTPPPPPVAEPAWPEDVIPEVNPYVLPQRHIPLDRRGRPHPGVVWSFLWCLLFLLVTQIPGAIIAVVIVVGIFFVAPDMLPENLLNTTALYRSRGMSIALFAAFYVTQFLVVGFSWLILRLVVGRDWTRQVGLRRPAWWHVALVLAAFLPMVMMANVVYQLFKMVLPSLGSTDSGTAMEQMVEIFSTWPWPLAVLVIGVGPGVGEELWCRGFLGRGLVGHYCVLAGVLLTSFFFGFIHLDPVQGSMAMVLGIWLHFTYLASRSILVPMLLHFLNNSLAVVASNLPFLDVLNQPLTEVSTSLVVSALVLLAVVAYALYQSRVRPVGFVGLPTLGGLGAEHPPTESSWHLAYPPPSPLAITLVVLAMLGFVVCLTRPWALGNL